MKSRLIAVVQLGIVGCKKSELLRTPRSRTFATTSRFVVVKRLLWRKDLTCTEIKSYEN